MRGKIISALIGFFLIAAMLPAPVFGQDDLGTITVINRNDQTVTQLTDGDTLRLRLEQPQAARQASQVIFQFEGAETVLAGCQLSQGESGCETEPFPSLGWFWGPDGTARESRVLTARANGETLAQSAPLQIAPRPVVMVHGFSSTWEAWTNYLGDSGYLAAAGLPGFAVGDGQVPGSLNTGRIDQPAGRTNTIAQNAAILNDYVQEVLQTTGAQKVDLLAHSMGGLISRYYIDRFVQDEVAQLIMLGSPMSGTECANLPAALNFYLPAAIEIQPLYVTKIFNAQITRRKGVAFHALAGVPIVEPIQSPCSPVPTDLAVSLESVRAIPLDLVEMPVLHTDLNSSETVFREYVLPLLQAPAGDFPAGQPDPAPADSAPEPLQFSRIFTGHIPQGGQEEVVVNIEAGVSLASFALYDSSRSLEPEVRGASGNVIELDPQANGLIRVEDPSMMLYLGYGFNNPRPGEWRITLQATETTPAVGADYALTAVFQGGAELRAETDLLLPEQGQPVNLTAQLASSAPDLKIGSAQAQVRLPDGSMEEIPLEVNGDQVSGTWVPRQAGLSYIQLLVEGSGPENARVDRTAFLVVETQPQAASTRASLMWMGVACAGVLGLFLLGGFMWMRRWKLGK